MARARMAPRLLRCTHLLLHTHLADTSLGTMTGADAVGMARTQADAFFVPGNAVLRPRRRHVGRGDRARPHGREHHRRRSPARRRVRTLPAFTADEGEGCLSGILTSVLACSVAGFSPPASDFSGGDPTTSGGQGLIETLCDDGIGTCSYNLIRVPTTSS